MQQELTMGSLFSGSGGFELASAIFGIEPRWASEIEPLPMLITKKNFPDMPHHGDIRYMNGGKVEAVTVIAGGSPCQDMSVAGQRAGLDGSRSNLFHEQIRIIKEMREHDRKAERTDKYIRPRFMVWENGHRGGGNVPMIMNEARSVDLRNQRLGDDKAETLHGCGHGSSVATVIEPTAFHITQDPTAFEGKSPCLTQGNPKTGQATIGVAIPIADKATRYKGGGDTRNNDGSANGLGVGEPGAPANTLTAADRHAVAYAIDRAAFNQGMNAQYNISIQEEIAQTLVAKGPGEVAHPQDKMDARCYAMQAFGQYKESEIASAIKARDFKDSTDLVVEMEYIIRRLTPLECCRLQGFPDDWTEDIAISEPKASVIREWMIAWAEWWRLIGKDEGIQLPKDAKQVERWLADPASDSGLYKMWGNGIALPCAMFVMEGIAEVLKEENSNESE